MELKRKNRVNAEFSMASMTDIIFLLLIFFMITSSAISQSAIEVKLPTADTANKDVVFVMGIAENHQYNLAIATTQEE